MTWHHTPLTGVQLAEGELDQQREDFSKAFKAASAPRAMALFQKERQDGGIDLFFTPECGKHAAALLEEWNCTPCDRPPMAGLHLLVGFNEITYYLF